MVEMEDGDETNIRPESSVMVMYRTTTNAACF